MQKATVTYVAPFGDSKVVDMGGVTFHDGKSVEINSYEHPHLMQKLPGNQHFDVVMGKEDDQPVPAEKRRGRPTNAQIAEAKAAAEKAEADAKEATEKAKVAKADAEAAVKAGSAKADKPGPVPAEPKADVKAGMSEAAGHNFEKDRQAEQARRDAQAQPQKFEGTLSPKPDPAV
jgi:hypothetical protein